MDYSILIAGVILIIIGFVITEIPYIPNGLAFFLSNIFIPLGIAISMLSVVLKAGKPNN